jgi:hypothetical protein
MTVTPEEIQPEADRMRYENEKRLEKTIEKYCQNGSIFPLSLVILAAKQDYFK